jgi:penicillin-binding protein 1A
MLAGLVRAPSHLAPTRNFGGARERADSVLQAMTETGAITAQQADVARGEPVRLRTPPETPPGTNYFVDMVAMDVRRLLGDTSGDATLRTTLSLELQRLAESIIERRLEADGPIKNVSQAALVAMAPDGAILAMVGGRDYEQSQFNRAVHSKRQAGSLFKLFVYLAAIQHGHTPMSVLVDRPVRIGEWEPQNYGGRFRGAVTLRNAFAHSINTVAVQLAEQVGIPAVIETAKRMGVQSSLPQVPSLALGSAEVTLLEMTRAFATGCCRRRGGRTIRPADDSRGYSAGTPHATCCWSRSHRPTGRQPSRDARPVALGCGRRHWESRASRKHSRCGKNGNNAALSGCVVCRFHIEPDRRRVGRQ